MAYTEKQEKSLLATDAVLSASVAKSVSCNHSGSGHVNKKPDSYWLASFIRSAIDKRYE